VSPLVKRKRNQTDESEDGGVAEPPAQASTVERGHRVNAGAVAKTLPNGRASISCDSVAIQGSDRKRMVMAPTRTEKNLYDPVSLQRPRICNPHLKRRAAVNPDKSFPRKQFQPSERTATGWYESGD